MVGGDSETSGMVSILSFFLMMLGEATFRRVGLGELETDDCLRWRCSLDAPALHLITLIKTNTK